MMMKRKDVVQLTGLCYSTVYNLEKKGLFPSRRQLSPGRVAWVRSEVSAWLANTVNVDNIFKALPGGIVFFDMCDGRLNMFHLLPI